MKIVCAISRVSKATGRMLAMSEEEVCSTVRNGENEVGRRIVIF